MFYQTTIFLMLIILKFQIKKFNKKDQSANQAIRDGFKELINRILLQEDKKKLSNLNLKDIKNLVTYYQITNKNKKEIEDNLAYNIQFDKKKNFMTYFTN